MANGIYGRCVRCGVPYAAEFGEDRTTTITHGGSVLRLPDDGWRQVPRPDKALGPEDPLNVRVEHAFARSEVGAFLTEAHRG